MGIFDGDNEPVGAINPEAKRKLVAWNKATPIALNPNIRTDACGSQIKLDRYGDRYSEYGWEVGYVVSLADGGSDTSDNWHALHWRNSAPRDSAVTPLYGRGFSRKVG